jgi:hypothetical protein
MSSFDNVSFVYPIFSNCTKYCTDEHWTEIFILCALNKYPEIIYDEPKNKITLKTKGVVRSLSRDEFIFYRQMIDIFEKDLGLKSRMDILPKIQKLSKVANGLLQTKINIKCEWKKIKPRIMKQIFIINYSIKKKEEMGLSQKQTKQLVSLIQIALENKQLTPEDIEYSNGVILNINNIPFDQKRGLFKVVS